MTFLNLLIRLIGSMRPIWGYVLNYVFCLAFLVAVPSFIRSLWRG